MFFAIAYNNECVSLIVSTFFVRNTKKAPNYSYSFVREKSLTYNEFVNKRQRMSVNMVIPSNKVLNFNHIYAKSTIKNTNNEAAGIFI